MAECNESLHPEIHASACTRIAHASVRPAEASPRNVCRPDWICSTRASPCSTPIYAWWPGTAPSSAARISRPAGLVGAPSKASSATTPNAANTAPGDISADRPTRGRRRNFSPHVPNASVRTAVSCCCAANRWPTAVSSRFGDVTEQRYIENLTGTRTSSSKSVCRRTAQLENANANLRRPTRKTPHRRRPRPQRNACPDQRHHPHPDRLRRTGTRSIATPTRATRTGMAAWRRRHRPRRARRDRPRGFYGQVQESVRKALSGQQVTYEYQMQRQGQTVPCPKHAGSGNQRGRTKTSAFRFSLRHHRPEAHAVGPRPGPENGGHRPADRRPGPRLQQPAHRRHRQPGALQDHRPDDAEVNNSSRRPCNRPAAACN